MKVRKNWLRFLFALGAALLLGASGALLGSCGPFTDILDDTFCPFVLEIFYLGITTGTTATTYEPAGNVTRLQMSAFLSRSADRILQRQSRRARYNKWWIPQNGSVLGLTSVGISPSQVRFDGGSVWVANYGSQSVSRIHVGDGRLLETWTGAINATGVVAAMGRIFVTGSSAPGTFYMIDPLTSVGAVTQLSNTLGPFPDGIAFDGARFWTANNDGSISIATPGATIPWTVTTIASGGSSLSGALYDGSNVWMTDRAGGRLLRFDSTGAVLQTVTVGAKPYYPVYDGANIWVPNYTSGTISIVRASTGAVLETLSVFGGKPQAAAYDGERVLVTSGLNNSVSVWRAADLALLGFSSTGPDTYPFGVCSDGLNFWITLYLGNQLARF